MNLTVRTVVFSAMAVTTLACCLVFSNPPTNPRAGVVVWLPKDIPGCVGYRSEMGEQEKTWLPPDTTFLKMTYLERWQQEEDAHRRTLHATLIVAGSDSRSLHRPEVCLKAQGWSITKREPVRLETAGGPLEVMDYHLSRYQLNDNDRSIALDAQGNKIVHRAHYVYWWVGPNDSTSSDEEKVWKSVWNSILKGENERWAYPSVMMRVDKQLGETGETECRKRIFEFIKEYAPEFQRSLGAEDREDATQLFKIR